MALVLADRVKETTTTTGTGALTLLGAVTGFDAVSEKLATNDTSYFACVHRTADEWEVFLGTRNGAASVARTTVLASSNGGSAVNFSAGTKDVFICLPASKGYVAGGQKVALADGGTGAGLADPGADRLMFWDESAGAVDWLELGTNLSITGKTLNATGGGGVSWGSISGTLADQTDLNTALDAKAAVSGDTYTGAHDFGGADSLELPNSAAPTVNADGEIAIDTTVSDFSHGIVKYYSGEELAVVALPVAELTTPTDGHVVAYNATNDEFELVAPSGGSSTVSDNTGFSDENGNEQLWFQTTASAVNYWEFTNAATGNRPLLQAQGSDTNVGGTIATKGTGPLRFQINGSDELELTASELAPVTVGGLTLGSYANRFSNVHLGAGNGVIMGPSGGYVGFVGDPSNNRFELYNNTGTCVTFRMTPGTATVAPFEFQAGTVLTTPVAGSVEYDGNVFYGTPKGSGSGRGIIPTVMLSYNAADVTLNNDANVQTPFASGADTFTVEGSTVYEFEMELYLTLGTTSRTYAFDFDDGTATFTDFHARVDILLVVANTDGTAQTTAWVDSPAQQVVSAASTAAGAYIAMKGTMTIDAGGTFIPKIKFSANPGGTNLCKRGSRFKLWPLGTSSVASVGGWA